MVLILSQSDNELSTENVIDWLYNFNVSYQRINGYQSEELPKKIDTNIKAVWYRRWNDFKDFEKEIDIDSKNKKRLNTDLNHEIKAQNSFFFYQLRNKYWLSNPNTASINKLIVLDKAKIAGFYVPDWEIVTTKKDLTEFKKKHNRIITKSIHSASYLNTKSAVVLFYTQEVTHTHIKALPNTFASSFCQKYIEKQFEIRAFFLNDKIYAMALMTNNDIDYRKRALELRKVPFKLPCTIEKKIKSLMKSLNLNTGSIDLIYGKDTHYYFLEVNPVGQFGMVSKPCNYYLERAIALNLCSQSDTINK